MEQTEREKAMMIHFPYCRAQRQWKGKGKGKRVETWKEREEVESERVEGKGERGLRQAAAVSLTVLSAQSNQWGLHILRHNNFACWALTRGRCFWKCIRISKKITILDFGSNLCIFFSFMFFPKSTITCVFISCNTGLCCWLIIFINYYYY